MTEHTLTVAGVAVDTRHWIGGERVASTETFTDVSPCLLYTSDAADE